MSIRRKLALLALFGSLSLVPLFAQTAQAEASVTLSWSAASGAGGYTVELATLGGKSVASVTVEGTQATVYAQPGSYLIRIVSLNNFMRPESASPWKRITIVRKGKPKVESITPAFAEPGVKSRIVLKGKNLDASTAVELRKKGSKNAIRPSSIRVIDATTIELSFPPVKELGLYSLQLVNKPDYTLLVPDAFAIKHKEALIASVAPTELDLLAPKPRISIEGEGIAPGASLRLERGDRRVDLAVISRSDRTVKAELPSGLEEGLYDLVIENDPLSISRAPGALRLFRPAAVATQAAEPPPEATASPPAAEAAPKAPAPLTEPEVAAAPAPEIIPTPSKAATITATATESVPSAATAPVETAPTTSAPTQAEAAATAATEAAPTAPAPPTEPKVAVTPSTKAETAPPAAAPVATTAEPATAAPSPNIAAEEPIAIALLTPAKRAPIECFSVAALWSAGFALGDWASILAPSFANADLSLRFRAAQWPLGGNQGAGKGPSLELGAELRAGASFFGTASTEATFVSSSFSNYNIGLGPWLALSWPHIESVLSLSGGVAYSLIAISETNLAPNAITSGSSVDPAASLGLEVGWKPINRLSVGIHSGLRCVFFSDQSLFTIPVGVNIRYDF